MLFEKFFWSTINLASNPTWPPKCIKDYFSELNLRIFEIISTDCDAQCLRQMINAVL